MPKVLIKKNAESLPWIVFLHGWGQNKESLFYLLHKCESFANCLALDLCGFGENFMNKPYQVADYVDDIQRILKEYHVIPNLIIGHSFGGKIGYYYLEKIKETPIIYLSPSLWKPRFSVMKKIRIFGYKVCRALKNKKIIKAIPRYFRGSNDYQASQGVLRETFLNVVNVYPNAEIQKYSENSYLIWGRKDDAVSFWQFKKMRKCFYKSQTYIVSGGHFAYLRHGDFIKNLAKKIIEDTYYANL